MIAVLLAAALAWNPSGQHTLQGTVTVTGPRSAQATCYLSADVLVSKAGAAKIVGPQFVTCPGARIRQNVSWPLIATGPNAGYFVAGWYFGQTNFCRASVNVTVSDTSFQARDSGSNPGCSWSGDLQVSPGMGTK